MNHRALLAAAALSGALHSFHPLRAQAPDPPPWNIEAEGHERRIDLTWRFHKAASQTRYLVQRAASAAGPFSNLRPRSQEHTVLSDYLGANDATRFYRVLALDTNLSPHATSTVVSATSRTMTDEELLTSVQKATFRYFWDYGHPVSGLARERLGSGRTVTSGGSGFGLMAIVVGADRGFVARVQAAARVLTSLRFLEERATRYHGAWPHWFDGATGKTIPFSRYDDGGDLVETSFLAQGLLTVRHYFQGSDEIETEIRRRATALWEAVEWSWYLKEPGGRRLYWHWSPTHEWRMNHAIGGHFNECLITYLLAIASPTHPIPPACYEEGWVGDPPAGYVNGTNYFGHTLWVGWPYGGPLFFTHYSFLGFDPRHKRDRHCNYFLNNRNISLIQQAYCAANPGGHQGYSALVWGLTASDTPGGYRAHEPRHDTGTISPTAALSAMPYVPEASLATLKHFYHHFGTRLWGDFGFKDAFNLDRDWFAESYLAIDQGPIVIMIENHRTGLPWKLFMANPEIGRALRAIGFADDPADPPGSKPAPSFR